MKESEFIELLNLYVDHEISASDSARLEAEVARNEARRQTYRKYCMMHKACDVLAAQYRDLPDETPSFAVEREKSAAWGWGAGLVTGGLLAAASLALVFVVHVNDPVKPTASEVRPLPVVASAGDAAGFHRAAPARLTQVELQTVLNTRDWTNPAAGQNPSLALDWMNKVELAPLQRTPFEQMPLFQDSRGLLSAGSSPLEVTVSSQDVQIERAAFQFQR
jgi:hypothetical protein